MNPPHRSLVWKRPGPVGQFEILRGLGGIVAPLLAGFGLSTVAVIATSADRRMSLNVALVLFTWASISFLLGMQFAFHALRHAASPEERLSWHPEAAVDAAALERERHDQAVDTALARIYERRTGRLYNAGLVFFIAGIAALVYPSRWVSLQTLAFAGVMAALALEIVWISGRGRFYRWLVPPEESITPTVSTLDDVSQRSLRRYQ